MMNLLQNINDQCSATAATVDTSTPWTNGLVTTTDTSAYWPKWGIVPTTGNTISSPIYSYPTSDYVFNPFGLQDFTGMIFATIINLQVTPCFKGIPMLHYIIDYEGDLRLPSFTTNKSWPFLFAGVKDWLFIDKVEGCRLHVYTAPHIKIRLDSKFAPLNQYNEQVTNQEIKDFINDVTSLQDK